MCRYRSLCVALVDALLEVKKQRLLFSLQMVEAEAGQKTESPDGEREGGEGDGDGSKESEDLQGIKCQAPIEEVEMNFKN